MRRASCVALACAALIAGAAQATVYYARDEALKLAFPDAERVETRDLFLTAEQRAAIEDRAKSKLDSDLLTIYIGHRGDQILGYAIFDTHTVRTLPETFLVVLTPGGKVASTYLMAFYEPTEYSPPPRWLAQFRDASLTDDLRVGRGIAAITGSTLTSNAVTGGIRRALATYEIALKKP